MHKHAFVKALDREPGENIKKGHERSNKRTGYAVFRTVLFQRATATSLLCLLEKKKTVAAV